MAVLACVGDDHYHRDKSGALDPRESKGLLNYISRCIRKILLRAISETFLPMFSSRIFMVSGPTLKFLIHYEFILVHCVRRWSSSFFKMYLTSLPSTM